MRINLNRLMGQRADSGQRDTWKELSEKTGVRRATLYAISRGELKQLRPEHIDALCTYYGVSAGEMIEAERVQLPIELNLRQSPGEDATPAPTPTPTPTVSAIRKVSLTPPNAAQPDEAEKARRQKLIDQANAKVKPL